MGDSLSHLLVKTQVNQQADVDDTPLVNIGLPSVRNDVLSQRDINYGFGNFQAARSSLI